MKNTGKNTIYWHNQLLMILALIYTFHNQCIANAISLGVISSAKLDFFWRVRMLHVRRNEAKRHRMYLEFSEKRPAVFRVYLPRAQKNGSVVSWKERRTSVEKKIK